MTELYAKFPNIKNERIVIRKMTEDDLESLAEITNNASVYKYIPPFLYKKSKGNLLAAIRNVGDRDFKKKKMIIAGIYLIDQPDKLIGLAEMFDYKKKQNQITIGYKLNEQYWHQGIVTIVIKTMLEYLYQEANINCVQAYVMPENIYSSRALLKNGFRKEAELQKGRNWGGKEIVELEVYTLSRTEYFEVL